MFINRLINCISFRIAIAGVFILLAATAASASEMWSEPDDDVVVARWSEDQLKAVQLPHAERLDEIRKHFLLADRPGESWRYDRIYGLMDGIGEEEDSDSLGVTDEIAYFRARLLQHGHDFTRAASVLENIEQTSAYYTSAQLMLSQVYHEQGLVKPAHEACLSLMLVQSDVAAICSMGLQSGADDSQRQLFTSFLNRFSKDMTPQGRSLTAWVIYQKAASLLKTADYEQVDQLYRHWSDKASLSVADLVHHSEALLQMKQPASVISLLQDYGRADFPDDALIVQLARAEQQISDGSYVWREYASERISQRINRRDSSYASLISLYYATLGEGKKMPELSWLSQTNDTLIPGGL